MASILTPVSILGVTLLSVPWIMGDFVAYQISLFLIYGIAAQGIGFLWGKTGVLPLGQALFFGVAAYATAMILRDVPGPALQMFLGAVALALIALAAFLLATLVFRGRSDSGPYFTLITLALVMIGEQIAGTASEITGGFNGLSGFTSIGGLDPFGSHYYLVVAVTVGVTALLLTLNRLPVNLIVLGVADNEPRMQLLGFPTHVLKGLAFAFSAIIAAIAGVLFASHQGIVTPTSTGFALSAELVILAAVGGRFHVFGPLIGAVVFGYAAAELRDSFAYWELLLAIIFIVVVLKAPGGLAELLETAFRKVFAARVAQSPKQSLKPSLKWKTAPPLKAAQTCETLHFDDVRLQIGVVKILNGVSFSTPSVGILSVIGPNGAGKTTILNTITGNLGISSGAIRLGGAKIDNRPPYWALRSNIGRKLQVPSVFFSMTVAQNLAIATMAGRASIIDLFKASTLLWQSPLLKRILGNGAVPLQDMLNQPVQHLPQGHRQFLEFAMTVTSEPAILLLDEPCAGLSPDETILMTELVKDYQNYRNGIIILIEHDMSIVQAISDKVLVLHQGAVLAYGSYDEIKREPAVQAVYAGDSK